MNKTHLANCMLSKDDCKLCLEVVIRVIKECFNSVKN